MTSDEIKILNACVVFFHTLISDDVHDHKSVFTILDDFARSKGYQISAEQRGIFGTRLFFEQVEM